MTNVNKHKLSVSKNNIGAIQKFFGGKKKTILAICLDFGEENFLREMIYKYGSAPKALRAKT